MTAESVTLVALGVAVIAFLALAVWWVVTYERPGRTRRTVVLVVCAALSILLAGAVGSVLLAPDDSDPAVVD